MAAVRTMMSAVRGEAAVITHEVAAVAKTEAIQSVKAAEGEVLNPLAVRQAVKATVQETTAKQPSILSEHLSITKSLEVADAPLSNTLPPTANITTTQTESIIAQHVEKDMGMSIKEVMVNASQTGVEESMDQANVSKLAGESGAAAAAV